MVADSTHTNPSKADRDITAARHYAVGIIRLATGRPSPGGLLSAYDYHGTLLKLHADVVGPMAPEDMRIVDIAVSLIRAAYDAEKKGYLDADLRNYYTRLQEAERSAAWATAYVARTDASRTSSAMVARATSTAIAHTGAPIADGMTQVAMQDVFAAEGSTFTLPSQGPRTPNDRRKPHSIYSRRGGPPQPIGTMVRVVI